MYNLKECAAFSYDLRVVTMFDRSNNCIKQRRPIFLQIPLRLELSSNISFMPKILSGSHFHKHFKLSFLKDLSKLDH